MSAGGPNIAAGAGGAETAGEAGVVIGLLGPTGVGKTAVALALAKRLTEEWPRPPGSTPGSRARGTGSPATGAGRPGRIISCDSMQVYRGFPVLTNQPTGDDGGTTSSAEPVSHVDSVSRATPVAPVKTISHVAVGFVDPDREFSVAQYAAYVRPLIEQDLSTWGWALVVGGTGLYMRAALAPLDVAAGGDPELRARLEARASGEGVAVLYEELVRLDPEAAVAIDPRNSRRVIRALEAITLTGRQWSGRADLWTPAYDHPTLLVGLVADRKELYRRIDLRAGRMLRKGAVEEVRRFREARSPEESRPGGPGIRSAIGYPEICRFLDGEQTLEDTVMQVAAATRRYARRQLTWLRKLKDAVIIDAQDREPLDVAQDILALARSGDRTRGSHRS